MGLAQAQARLTSSASEPKQLHVLNTLIIASLPWTMDPIKVGGTTIPYEVWDALDFYRHQITQLYYEGRTEEEIAAYVIMALRNAPEVAPT